LPCDPTANLSIPTVGAFAATFSAERITKGREVLARPTIGSAGVPGRRVPDGSLYSATAPQTIEHPTTFRRKFATHTDFAGGRRPSDLSTDERRRGSKMSASPRKVDLGRRLAGGHGARPRAARRWWQDKRRTGCLVYGWASTQTPRRDTLKSFLAESDHGSAACVPCACVADMLG